MSDASDPMDALSPEKRELLELLLEEQGDQLDVLPLSFAQQRMWLLNQLEPNSALYNIPAAVRLTGELNVAALEYSLNHITQRHEILHTTFQMVDDQPVQIIQPWQPLALPVLDLRELPDPDALRRLAVEEARRPFDLVQGPLLRACLLQTTAQEHVLLLTLHHIVADGWSIPILIQELAAFYSAFLNDTQADLPELPIQYADYAVWQREQLRQDEPGNLLDEQLAYWRHQLAPEGDSELPALDLPIDHPRPAMQSYHGARHPLAISQRLTQAIKDLSRRENVTPFMTLVAAFKTLLFHYTGQRDLLIGTPTASRTQDEIEGLIGCFVNTLVLRTKLADNPSFRDLLQQVRVTTLGAYNHQDLPFEMLVEALQPRRDLSRSPLFQVQFTFHNRSLPALELPGLALELLDIETGTAKFDLTLTLEDSPHGLRGDIEYSTDLFEPSTITRMAGHFQTLLTAIAADPDRHIAKLPLLQADERRQLLLDWNATSTPYAAETCIHQLFEAQVAQTPDAVAVVFNEQQLSYRELNARANQLARHLRMLGVNADSLVGICLERSLDLIVGMLAVLKAGAAYLPLDPAYPQERIGFMIEDANVAVLLTNPRLAGLLPQHTQVVALEHTWPQIAQLNDENLSTTALPHNLAYVIYTSGSTGQPKGVMVTHRNLANFVAGMDQRIGASPPGVWLALTSISFDISVLELLWTLARGFKVVVYDERRQILAPDAPDLDQIDDSLPAQLVRHQVTHLQCTPSQARMLLSEPDAVPALQSVRTLLLGGEVLPIDLARQLHDQIPAGLHNMYGPTETTIWSATHQVQSVEASIPLGRPIANTQIYILDAQLEPVSIGVVGELCIGGDGVVRGYLNRPGLTAERFIPDPFGSVTGARLYRTGDLARYRADGTIEFLGRTDQQVKLRGYRIELGEIEAALRQHPAIDQAVVMARADEATEARLVAYIVQNLEPGTKNLGEEQSTDLSPSPTATEAEARRGSGQGVAEPGVRASEGLTSTELRAFLSDRLPEYMIPAVFVTLAALPLTPNGKLDRRALPAPGVDRPELAASYIAPRNELEQRIAEIWAALLRLERVGVDDNFFELGGTSLLLVQARVRLREALGRDVPLVELFQYPSISALARHLSAPPTQSSSSAAMDKVRQQAERQKQARQQKRTTRRSTS